LDAVVGRDPDASVQTGSKRGAEGRWSVWHADADGKSGVASSRRAGVRRFVRLAYLVLLVWCGVSKLGKVVWALQLGSKSEQRYQRSALIF
jgi:hypothetical protein